MAGPRRRPRESRRGRPARLQKSALAPVELHLAFILAFLRFMSRPITRPRKPVGCESCRAMNRGVIFNNLYSAITEPFYLRDARTGAESAHQIPVVPSHRSGG